MSKKKILVVDDEQSILTLLEYNLVQAGFEVITATDGEEGISKAADDAPDLVIPVSYTHLTLPTMAVV